MVSIVQIVKSETLLGSQDYSLPEHRENPMFLYSKQELISPNSLVQIPCSVFLEDLGYIFSTPNKPHNSLHLGFCLFQILSSSLNHIMVAEQLHREYYGSCDLDAVFKDAFPNLSGEVLLHEDSNGVKSGIYNEQWYLFSPVERKFQDKIKKEYSQIMGQELLVF